MQKLHLVGLTTDRRGLIFSSRRGTKTGSFVVDVDRSFLDAVADLQASDGAARGGEELGRETSSLSVRDVQALLRRGQTIEQVAKAAGVSPQWVGRFAAPVLAERTAVLDELHEVIYEAPRKGASTAPLGDSIRWHLRDKGVPDAATAFDEGWAARQLDGDDWAVTLRYRNRQRRHEARWHFNRRSRDVSAENRLAAELAYLAPPGAPAARPAPAKATGGPRRASTSRPKPAKAPPKKAPSTKAPSKKAKESKPVKAKTGKAVKARAAKAVTATTAKAAKAKTAKSAPKKAPPSKAKQSRAKQAKTATARTAKARSTAEASRISTSRRTRSAPAARSVPRPRARRPERTAPPSKGDGPAGVPQPPAPDDSVDPVDLVGEPVVVAPPVEATPVVHAPPAEPELPPFLAALEPGPPAALERAAWPPSADGRAHRYGRDSVSATRRRRAPLRAERNGQGERTDRS